MQLSRVLELLAQRRFDRARQYGYTILVSLTVPDQYLASGKVHVLDAEPHPLHDAHTGPAKEPPDQRMDLVQLFERPLRLFARKHDRESPRHFRLLDPSHGDTIPRTSLYKKEWRSSPGSAST